MIGDLSTEGGGAAAPDPSGAAPCALVAAPLPGANAAKPARAVAQDFGGSILADFNNVLLRDTIATVWGSGGKHDEGVQRRAATMMALKAFKPEDEIEGMLAAQAVALHFGAMECLRRAMHPDQPAEIATKLRKDGANLARGMTDMLAALDRKRGKGGAQTVRVEHVTVQAGGQAIVGAVRGAGAAGRGEE